MRTGLLLLVALAMVLALALTPRPASAQTVSGEYPNVANLEPFSPESSFMSLPGYLRLRTFQEQHVWLTYAEATRIVIAQGGIVSPQARLLAERGSA
jgi:hypothetical protein